jgi:hypothetical protein
MKANVSKHKALSYGHACKLETQLKEEIEQLLARSRTVDEKERLEGGWAVYVRQASSLVLLIRDACQKCQKFFSSKDALYANSL